jgi:hypothetical protein
MPKHLFRSTIIKIPIVLYPKKEHATTKNHGQTKGATNAISLITAQGKKAGVLLYSCL